jgi:hypothetical protein
MEGRGKQVTYKERPINIRMVKGKRRGKETKKEQEKEENRRLSVPFTSLRQQLETTAQLTTIRPAFIHSIRKRRVITAAGRFIHIRIVELLAGDGGLGGA